MSNPRTPGISAFKFCARIDSGYLLGRENPPAGRSTLRGAFCFARTPMVGVENKFSQKHSRSFRQGPTEYKRVPIIFSPPVL